MYAVVQLIKNKGGTGWLLVKIMGITTNLDRAVDIAKDLERGDQEAFKFLGAAIPIDSTRVRYGYDVMPLVDIDKLVADAEVKRIKIVTDSQPGTIA